MSYLSRMWIVETAPWLLRPFGSDLPDKASSVVGSGEYGKICFKWSHTCNYNYIFIPTSTSQASRMHGSHPQGSRHGHRKIHNHGSHSQDTAQTQWVRNRTICMCIENRQPSTSAHGTRPRMPPVCDFACACVCDCASRMLVLVKKVVLTFEVLSAFKIHRKEGYWAIITLI